MRHKCKGRKLGSNWSHTQAMKRSLTQALLSNDRIKTTEPRAKEIRRDVDKIITWAKKGDLHSRRLAIAALGNDKELVREVFEKVNQGMFKDRPGGYTRIMKLGPRKGDGAPMVIMELVTENCVPKATKATKATPKKKATKKAEDTEHESVIDEIKESVEAAEENFAEEVREDGQEQLAEERAEVAAEDEAAEEKAKEKARKEQDAIEAEAEADKKAEKETKKAQAEVREEQFKAEEARAKDTEAAEREAEAEEKAN